MLPRRADAVAVIGGLEIAAVGMGHRRIAAALGRAEGTVRGWVRRVVVRAEALRSLFTTVLVSVAEDPVPPVGTVGASLADAVVAVLAAAEAVAGRFALRASPWEVACRVARGTLSAPR
ncbi:hypothetical protein ACPA54_04355 [Uniformispora flossi]|uniref:hypothetical protein n=1 Tax=Uniformispora flossi TaxID=3390723 RepID=UPI003C2E6D4F